MARVFKSEEMTVFQHLEELRRVLIISIITIFIMAVACWAFSDRVLYILLQPVAITGNKMVYISITEAIMTKIKLAFFLGFLAALPVTLWQFWGFIIPALRKVERIYFTFFVLLSFLFFIGGVVFGFLVVFRLCVMMLLKYGGAELVPMLSIGKYISFTINFLLPFGLVFEMPLAAFFLARLELLSYRTMARGRKAAIVAAVVIASALVASPEIFSVLLMAAPIYLLYEVSATIVRVVEWGMSRKREGRTLLPFLAPVKRLVQKLGLNRFASR
ncbi:MAG: twin-arginine translocase subunit TatC [Bacillota bacterium]